MKTGLVILGGLLLIGSFGCAPRLAQTQLGSEEEVWQGHIKKSYPAWKAPQTTPPTVAGNVVMETSDDIDIVVETDTIVLEQPKTSEIAPTPTAAPETPAASQTYTVQKGDTLSAISVKMYSTSREVGRILEANRGIIKDKNRISPGMTLVIPAL